MKIVVNIVLFLFLTFLAAPTLVCLLKDDDKEASVAYNVSDEEMHKDSKEVKAMLHSVYQIALTSFSITLSIIKSKDQQKHTSVCCDIFLPPPRVV